MRLRVLDGLRALSILLVILSHVTTAHLGGQWLLSTWGNTGVALFFAISGYIITLLLIREDRDSGTLNLGSFYIRRAFRILPPLWTFLLVTFLVSPGIEFTQYLRVLLFLTDYVEAGRWWLNHSWSLSVEEQFYLLWPVTFVLAGPRRSTHVALALVLLAPPIRVGGHLLGVPGKMGHAMHTILDAIMAGCLLALLQELHPRNWVLPILRNSWTALAGLCFLLLGSPLLWRALGAPYVVLVGYSLRSVAAASIIAWAVSATDGLTLRVLSSSPLVHLGVVSYSWYLYQQPFFDPAVRGTWVGSAPVAVFGSLAAAEASYWLVERTSLRLRGAFLRRAPAPTVTS